MTHLVSEWVFLENVIDYSTVHCEYKMRVIKLLLSIIYIYKFKLYWHIEYVGLSSNDIAVIMREIHSTMSLIDQWT